MTLLRDRDSLLPNNATAFERAQSESAARMLDSPVEAIRAARIGASAPASLLPFLAWERSVHHPRVDETTLRARIDASFADHLSYGAPAALEQEIALDTGLSVRIVEFFEEPDLQWPDFIIEVVFDPAIEAQPDLSGVWLSAVRWKNVRDWPSKLRLKPLMPPTSFNVGSAPSIGLRVRVLPEGALPPLPTLFAGAATRAILEVRVLPQ